MAPRMFRSAMAYINSLESATRCQPPWWTLGCMQRSAAMRRLRKRDRAAPAAPAAPVTRNKVLKQLQLVLDEASVKHCEPVNIFTLASAFTRKT